MFFKTVIKWSEQQYPDKRDAAYQVWVNKPHQKVYY